MILLLGGLGNVGLNLTSCLKSLNIDFAVLGRQNPKIVKDLFPDIPYIYGDLSNERDWGINDDYDIVINLAYSSSNFGNSVIKENKILMNNLYNNTKEIQKVIHISTTAVGGYGSNPNNALANNYCWDDFYTLAKSVQEAEIYKYNYPFQVIRIGNYFDKDSIFLKSLAILSQLEIDKNDFNFYSDITTTDDIYNFITSSNSEPLVNLYHPVNYSWSELINTCKSKWDISNNIYYDFSKIVNNKNNKYLIRYLTKFIPIRLQPLLEMKIKRNKYLLNLFQQQVSIMEHISPIYRVKRKEFTREENIASKVVEQLITSLNNNASNYRLK